MLMQKQIEQDNTMRQNIQAAAEEQAKATASVNGLFKQLAVENNDFS